MKMEDAYNSSKASCCVFSRKKKVPLQKKRENLMDRDQFIELIKTAKEILMYIISH